MLLTVLSFVFTVGIVAALGYALLGLPWITVLVLGAILGGTSTSVIVPLVRMIHSVASESAIQELGRHRDLARPGLKVMIEVDLAGESTKAGVSPEQLDGLIARCPFPVVGLMTMPPLSGDPDDSRRWFSSLRQLADEWAPLSLRVVAEPAKRAALAPLLADRPELLATDAGTAVAHLDLPWSSEALHQRYAAHAGQGGLPVAWLLPEGGLSAALQRTPLPPGLDDAPAWWPDADWAALMERLPILLDW